MSRSEPVRRHGANGLLLVWVEKTPACGRCTVPLRAKEGDFACTTPRVEKKVYTIPCFLGLEIPSKLCLVLWHMLGQLSQVAARACFTAEDTALLTLQVSWCKKPTDEFLTTSHSEVMQTDADSHADTTFVRPVPLMTPRVAPSHSSFALASDHGPNLL